MARNNEDGISRSIMNHPASLLPGPGLLHHLVQTESGHGASAVDFLAAPGTIPRSVSYRDLHDASDKLAERIWHSAGVDAACQQFIVPVLLPQGPELYITLLAILKAGGAFCPLNLDVPLERARFILGDVSATIVITNSDLASRIPTDLEDTFVLCLDDEASPASGVSSSPEVRRQPTPTDVAYVMYTSGSTGTPKGVAVSHQAVTQSLLAHNKHIPSFSRFLQFAAPTFDVSVFEIFFPLFRGNTLVGCSRSAMLNDLQAVMREMNVDACELTPTVAGSLLRKRERVPGLKLLLTIGEMLTQPVIEEFGGSAGRESLLWAMYGPTEAAIHCTVQPAFAHNSLIGNIGVPLDTVSAFIFRISDADDETSNPPELELLPQGETGELVVGGYQVAEGYINRPEITAKAFIDTAYGRLYRTGDKARIRPDGTLECLGRISEGQVKLRGQRIELGEIEHAAMRTDGCHGAFASVIANILVLFCAVDDVPEVDMSSAIQQSCVEWLPGFMVPGDIIVLREFPRLPSGKVDRKGMMAEYSIKMERDGEEHRPLFSDEVEEQVCRIASEVLGTEILPDHNLARVGMDSLVAIRFASALREAGLEASVVDILSSRTISLLRVRIKEPAGTNPRDSSDQNIEPGALDFAKVMSDASALRGRTGQDIEAILPCTPLQTSMLAETKTNPQAYCNWVKLSFPPEHSETTILSWFLEIARVNEALRTGFVHDGEQFLQVVFRELDLTPGPIAEGSIEAPVKAPEYSVDRFGFSVKGVEQSIGALEMSLEDFSSCATIAERPINAFEMSSESEFLRPIRIQILPLRGAERTAVVLQIHHAVYDGWSMDMILSDLEVLARGESLVPRPQFRRASSYYQSGLFKRDSDEAREFWAENLVGFQPSSLPLLRPELSRSSEVLSTSIPLNITPDSVRRALGELEAGPQTIFQSALAWLWGSLVGTDDVVIGTVTSGRTIPVPRIEDIIGPCIAAVPLRTNLSQVRTIRDLMASVHAANRALLPHSVLPLSEIKRATGHRSGQPVYDVLFVYQESLHSMAEFPRTIWEVSRQDYLETKLLVEIEPKQQNFMCRLTFHTNNFPEDQINILGESIRSLVSHMLGDLDSELGLIQKAFLPNLLSVYNPKPRTFSGVSDLATAVEAAVAKYPAKEALCFADCISDDILTTTTMSFAGLNKIANRIAWLLIDFGAREGDVVAIVMEKSILLYAGILAILKIGCTYLPLLPSTPISRVDAIFHQTDIKLCLTDRASKSKYEAQLSSPLVDIQSSKLSDFSESNPSRTVNPDRVSYIIFTSGSTGVPKGVCVTQLNIMSNLDVLSRIYPVKHQSRLLQSCSQAFDVSVFEIFFAWTRAMCLCSATNDTLFADLELSIRKLGVTHLSMTPTVASLIDPHKVPNVKFLVTSGEAMTDVVARKWARQLYQGYGPSETTNICSVKKMGLGQPIIQHLGWSFDNTSTVVLFRDSMEVVPFGCLGELCFGGDQVAQGYLNMAELTAMKFIDHPQFGRLYRSGDLGRMLPDGSMVITGRVDDQIKIRGQRVELGEINSVVWQSKAVADCTTCFFKEGATGSGQIVTFFVPKDGKESQFRPVKIDLELAVEVQRLFESLAAQLPGYMVPSLVVPVSVLPTTASGKLDRGRLRETIVNVGHDYLALASPNSGARDDDGHWTDSEVLIAEIVSAVFGVNKAEIRRWTPLTTLGLDSISAIRLSNQMQVKLGKRVAISTILQSPSIAKLAGAVPPTKKTEVLPDTTFELLPAELIESVAKNAKTQGRVVDKILPCTPLQEAMLATSNTGSYLNKMLFRINGHPLRVVEAWKRMCERHTILRTCFITTHDPRFPIVQVIFSKWDHTWLNLETQGQPIEDCVTEHAGTLPNPIDVLEPVVSFATITQLDAVYLSVICHHALYDGVAIEHLLFEVEQVICGVELPPTPVYDTFLQEAVPSDNMDDAFWLDQLAGYNPNLVTRYNRGDMEQYSPPFVTRDLGIPLSQVYDIARQLGVSLLSIAQAAWAITLCCLFNTNDICFGNVVSGRSLPIDRIDELVAPCFNTIPVRMQLEDKVRNLDVMKGFQNLNPRLIQHQFAPLRRIQSLFSRKHGENRRLLFDTLLLLQHPSRPLDKSIWTLVRDDGEMDIPVVCEVLPDTQLDLFSIKMHLQPNRFPSNFADNILDLFSDCLRSLFIYPASHILSPSSIRPDLRESLELLTSRFQAVRLDPETPPPDNCEGWTAVESTIRDVISNLSSSPTHRIHQATTIYQLGLDSISAVQIASILRKRGLDVSASDVISNPSCKSLARQLERQTTSATGQETPYDVSGFQNQVQGQTEGYGIAPSMIESILPCTPLQAGMMTQFVKSGGRDYFNYIGFQLDSTLTIEVVVEAWQRLYHAHPILRSRLVPVEHNDCSFALVQFRPDAYPLPVISFQEGHGRSFHVDKWRLDAAHNAAAVLHGQLWSVAVVQTEQDTMMHLGIHHCLYDAHSLQLLLKGLARAVRKEPVVPMSQTLTETAVADILGQISNSSGRSQDFWKKKAGKAVVNKFPIMTPLKESSRSILVESVTSGLPFNELEDSVARCGYTLQVILQAAWTRILSSYLGESSVIFGVVLSGRNTEATQTAAFPCISTLPVIAGNTSSNHDLLQQMLAYNTELYRQQHQPLTRIQQWVGKPDTKLFDTLLVYQKFDVDVSETRPWSIVDERATVDYPVSLEVEHQAGDQLKYQITFFSDVLPREQARIILGQFDAAVRHLALDPNGQEDSLIQTHAGLFSILPAEKPVLSSPIRFLHEFVEVQAAEIPHQTALHFINKFDGDSAIGREWTYAELNNNGNRVAHLLLPLVKTGEIVAIYFDKCPEAIFSILGILKAGCSFVALDPGAPAPRKQFIIEDSGATVLLTSRDIEAQLDIGVSIPVLSIDVEALGNQPCHAPILTRELLPSDVCYCLYTSGTTGVPKGCEITHDNAVQCMLAFQEIFKGHWTDDSRWLQFASLHFDVSVLEQYWSWSVGITLVGAPRDVILEDLAGTISKLNITHIDLTPSLARLLHPDDVPSLCKGVFITGGESLKQEILDVWGAKAVIYNFYGPTEATIGVTVYPRVPQNGRASNIGRQFINVGSYVLKLGTDIPVLKGAVGELCVSGKLVGKGYLKREDLTSERFPTLESFGERIYRTGDLVRVLHDGCFDFLGRADDQVKLRGQRLEIGEINQAIRAGVEEIKDVATIVVRNEKQQKDFLVSFVVAESEVRSGAANAKLQIVNTPDAQSLCTHARLACQSKLPRYMVPTYVLQLSFIPLSPNNKAEIKQLRELFKELSHEELASLSSSTNAVSGQFTDSGKRVVKVIAAMQSVDIGTITPTSSIFEVGIDSISVLRLARALKKEGFTHASPSQILRNPIIHDLSHALDSSNMSRTAPAAAAARQLVQACGHKHRSHVCRELNITPEQIEYIVPCSPLQLGMISRSAADGAYFNTFQFSLSVGTSKERLHQAWQRVVDTCPILRTLFVKTTDGFVQVALKSAVLAWQDMTISDTVEEVVQSRRKAWITENQENLPRPLEVLFINHDQGAMLVLNIFHGLYDANSLDLMLERVRSEYVALDKSRDRTPSTLDHASSPSFLGALCHGPLHNFASCKPFWVEHLKGVRFEPLIPVNGVSSGVAGNREVPFVELEVIRKRLGVTHQSIIQAAWCWVLSKYFSTDATIGMIVSGRNIELECAEKVVGPLFNTLPFHPSIQSGEGRSELSWTSLIRQCHDFNSTVLDFQHVPLRDIQKWCSGGKPLFDILFSFQRDEAGELTENQLWTEVHSDPHADYPLALEATLTPSNDLRLLIVASEGGVGYNGVQVMLAELEKTLDAMMRDPDQILWSGATGEEIDQHQVPGAALGHVDEMKDSTALAGFVWTATANLLREEISTLADVPTDVVTAETSVFELGLDSIDLIKLSAALKEHGVKIKTSQLMKAQSIQTMAQILEEDRGLAPPTEGSKSPNSSARLRELLTERGYHLDNVTTVLPATPLQDSMMVEMIESDFQLYFNHDTLEISPNVDVKRLKDAWVAVIRGSPILRTTFIPVESPDLDFAYCQLVNNQPQTAVAEVDILGKEDLALLVDGATKRARIGKGESSLLQVVIANAPGQQFLVLSIAHALYDGQSLGFLHQDVQAAYQGRYLTRQPYEPYLEDVVFSANDKAPGFWSEFLDGAVPTMFPENSAISNRKEMVHRAEADSSLPMSDIKGFCKRHAVTVQTLGQACLAALLATRTRSLDVTFGVVLSGRDSEYAEGLMFPTMNTVAMRSVLHGTVSSWLRYMQENSVNVAPFQHFPLRRAQKLARGVNGPLFNTLFIQQRRHDKTTGYEQPVGIMRSIDASSAVEYPVCVEIEVGDASLIWRTACDESYVSREETSVLLHQLDVVLRFFVNSPDDEVLTFSGKHVSICGLPEFVPGCITEDKVGLHASASSKSNTTLSPEEDAIRNVLAEVSSVPATSIFKTHNIYNLGLDSISAMRVSSALRKKGIVLKFRDMLKAKSIQEMASLVASQADGGPATMDSVGTQDMDSSSAATATLDLMSILNTVELPRDYVERVIPATSMQVYMLSVWQNTRGEVFYPEFTYKLSGDIDENSIGSAWRSLVAEMPILRTVFLSTTVSDVPIVQVVVRPSAEDLVISLIPKLEDSSTTDSRTWTYHQYSRFEHQPLNSLTATKDTQGTWILRLRVHHALYDAVSLPLIMKRFSELCDGSQIPGLSNSVSSAWLGAINAHILVSRHEARRQFWAQYLAGVVSTPFNWEPPAQSEHPTSSRVSLVRPSAIHSIAKLKSVCETNGVSIQALFLAAYARFLARTQPGPDKDVVFGVYLANRGELDDSNDLSYYPTLCLVPVRVRVESGTDDSLVEIAARVQEDLYAISAPENVSVGLWEIKEWTGVVVDSFVNFLSFPIGPVNVGEGSADIKLVQVEGGSVEEEGYVPGRGHEYIQPPELENNRVKDAYPNAVDVEVSLQGGSMTVGVFGPGQKLGSAQGAGEVIEAIAERLMLA